MKTRMHLVRRSLSAALLLAVAGAGCATDDGAEPDPDPSDTTAPLVQSTVPAAAATGIAAGSTITVTFSEGMDPATVEAAYASADLPRDEVALSWNAAGTVLTITPSSPLVYAEGAGTDPMAVLARTYAITIGAGAADLAGNPLEVAMELEFATRRRLAASFGLDPTLTRVSRNSSLQGLSNDIWVGDNGVDNTFRSYLTYDLSAMPLGIEVEAAAFVGRQLAPDGAPYNLGPVLVQHLSFSSLNGLGGIAPLSVPGMFSDNATAETKSVDVTSQVADDMANRGARNHRSQYRMQIDTPFNGNNVMDRANFALGTFEMTVTYVAE